MARLGVRVEPRGGQERQRVQRLAPALRRGEGGSHDGVLLPPGGILVLRGGILLGSVLLCFCLPPPLFSGRSFFFFWGGGGRVSLGGNLPRLVLFLLFLLVFFGGGWSDRTFLGGSPLGWVLVVFLRLRSFGRALGSDPPDLEGNLCFSVLFFFFLGGEGWAGSGL